MSPAARSEALALVVAVCCVSPLSDRWCGVGGTVAPGIGWYSDACDCDCRVAVDADGTHPHTAGDEPSHHAAHVVHGSEAATATVDTNAASKRHLTQHMSPGVFTSISPAWNNDNLFRLSNKIRCGCDPRGIGAVLSPTLYVSCRLCLHGPVGARVRESGVVR